jgi:di/tricarboxylate transporter
VSKDAALADQGYRPIGKHRFGAKIIGLVLALALIGFLLSYAVPSRTASSIMRLLTTVIWIVQSIRSILMSDEQLTGSDPVFPDASPRNLRGWSVATLIGFTALATLEFRSFLFVPE